MAWDTTKVDAVDDVLAADWNSMVTDQKTRGIPARENLRGSNCTLNDGNTSRVLTLANTTTTKSGGFMIFVNGLLLHSAEYSVTHNATGSTVTFSNAVFDADYIAAIYFM